MTKKATRSEEYTDRGVSLFMAFELGVKDWKLGFSTRLGEKPCRRTIAACNLDQLQQEIAAAKRRFGLAKTAGVLSCYEAGRDGFWLDRYLRHCGIRNLVVDSSSIEVNRRARRAKSDRLDVGKLLSMLVRYHFGERKLWSVVRVPTREQEDGRQLHRELRTLKKERARTSNRIKGLLAGQGMVLQGAVELLDKRLEGMRLWDGSALPSALLSRLKREWEHVVFLKRQILALECEQRGTLSRQSDADMVKVRQLRLLRGIGRSSSWVLVREFFGWRDFKNRRQVACLAGLTPTPYQSGTTSREQGISKAGNRHIRAVAIELAWSWLRYQPDSKLTEWYSQRFARAGRRARKVGIVALARRLLIELWRYLEWGVLPEGALLKPFA